MSAYTMKEDLFTNLPEEMTREILRRVPIKSLFRSKCVRKSWRGLIDEPEFKSSYSPKPCLAFSCGYTYMVYDGEACEPLFRFWMGPDRLFYGENVRYSDVIDSTDGLLLAKAGASNSLFVCNPMTQEYVVLPRLYRYADGLWAYGFGVSKISGQYKVLNFEVISRSYYVYTLGGGGSWRSISAAAPGSPILVCNNPTFCNGNLHWLISCFAFKEKYMVCCFDLDTELFTSFSLPPIVYSGRREEYLLCNLEGRLCLCDFRGGYNAVIWLMNKYGDENSWIKEYTFCLPRGTFRLMIISPLKVLDNGDLLFVMNLRCRLYIYSKQTKDVMAISHIHLSTSVYYNIATYTPSFRSLKAMGIHNVQSLNLYS